METIIARLAIILMGISFQVSALAVLFSRGQVPNIILLIIIAWTIIVGFNKIWPWTIIAGVILDLASFEPIGKNVIFLLIVSYAVNFFLQRFLTENRIWRVVMISFFVVATTIFYASCDIFFVSPSEMDIKEKISFMAENAAVQIIASAMLFYVCYALLKKVEDFLSFRAFQVKVKR